jgi:hypothetical protein
MAKGYSPEVQSFNKKWDDLAKTTRQLGIPDEVSSQVYQLDLKRLSTPGSYTQSGDQLLDEIKSAAQGKPNIAAPPPDPANVAGNLGTDVKDFGAGLAGLINKGVGDIVHPTHIASQVSALWRDPKVLRTPLHELLNSGSTNLQTEIGTAGQSPLLASLVPGLADAAAFTKKGPGGQYQWTGAGGDQLAEHPFTSALDVAPLVHGAGRLGSIGARVGVSDADRAVLDQAGKYKPTDTSPEAQAARARAKEVIPQYTRLAAATNPKGLLTFMNRFVLGLPFQDDTVGGYVAHKLNTASSGQLGPISAAVARLMAVPGNEYAHGLSGFIADGEGFAERHGIDNPDDVRAFTDVALHYTDDWQKVYAGKLTPDQMSRFAEALPEYDAAVMAKANADLAKERLGILTDPRTGRTELRSTTGLDSGLLRLQKRYIDTRPAFLDAAHSVAHALGPTAHVGLDNAKQDVAAQVSQMLAPMHDYTPVHYLDSDVVQSAFPPDAARPGRTIRPALPAPVRSLMGPRGRIATFEAALAKGNLSKALAALRGVRRGLSSPFVDRNARLSAMRDPVDRAIEALRLMNTEKVKTAIATQLRVRDRLTSSIDRHPEAKYLPRYTEMVQDGLVKHLAASKATVTTGDYDLVFDQIANGIWKGEKFDDIVGKGEMAKIKASALAELAGERDNGLEPKFVYSANTRDPAMLQRGLFDVERIRTPRSAKSRVALNPSAIYDPIMGLTIKSAEDLQEHVMESFFYGEQGFLPRFGMSHQEILNQASMLVKDPGEGTMFTKGHAIDKWIGENYVEFDPEQFIPRATPRAQGAGAVSGVWVPKDIADSFEANLKSMGRPRTPVARTYAHGTNLFRFSLLNFSPRYQVHIYGGGAMLLAMRGDPLAIPGTFSGAVAMMARDSPELVRSMHDLRRNAVWRPMFDFLVKRGEQKLAKRGEEGGLPVELAHGTGEQDPTLLAGYKWASGKKLGGWLRESMAKKQVPVDAGLKMANFGANMLRAMAYLSKKDPEAGIEFVRKVYADMSSMTPLERSIIRYVMPFYGWTKHIVQFVATYPIDHPYRAQVLSQMVNQEWEDWNTGIPQSMIYLFQIGGTSADGTAEVLDIRQLDPLRSVSDVFTMGGFLSSLNPAIQTAISALGINTQTGGPEDLYPTLTLDSFYGSLQNQPTSLSTVLTNAVGQYIPESGVLDHFLQQSAYTKWAANNNAHAYQSQLYGALNFPWVPYTVNAYQTLAKTESDRYDVAKADATAALADPDPNSPVWQNLLKYSYVPYSGYLVQPMSLRKWAFDQVYQAGYWNGAAGVATIPPNNVVSAPYSAPY